MDSTICNMCAPNTFSEAAASACEPCPNGTSSDAGVCESCAPGTYRELQATLWSGLERWEAAAVTETCAQACVRKGLVCTPAELSAEAVGLMRSCTFMMPCEAPETCAWFYTQPGGDVCAAGMAGCDAVLPSGLEIFDGHLLCPCALPQGVSGCIPCPPGEFAPAGAGECIACAKPLVPAAGQGECEPCAAGLGWHPAPARCEPCPLGTFGEGGECMECAAGTYSDVIESDECKVCGAGGFVPSDRQTCELCQPGTYGTGVACVACAAGTYSASGGAGACDACGAGGFVPSDRQSCELCPPGTYGTGVACVACAAGTYSESGGSEACKVCGAGGFVPSDRQTCEPCPPGTYGTGVACVACAGGSYSAAAGASACDLCAAGTYSADSSRCEPCLPGQYAPPGSAVCVRCAPGSYQPAAQAAECVACAAGKAFGGTGGDAESVCVLCGAGKYSGEGQSICTPCQAGKFSTAVGAALCDPCPPGTTGPVGAAALGECKACLDKTFAAEPGSPACKVCNGTVVLTTGYEVWRLDVLGFEVGLPYGCRHVCPAGFHAVSELNTRTFGCAACAVGTYQPQPSAATTCLSCPAAMSTPGRGARSCECDKGFFLSADGAEARQCVSCEEPTFKPVVGNMSCWLCDTDAEYVDGVTCRCEVGGYLDVAHLLSSGLPCKACPRYQSTAEAGATDRAACECDVTLNVQACASCKSGCECIDNYTPDVQGGCSPCEPEDECLQDLDSAGARVRWTVAALVVALSTCKSLVHSVFY